MPQITLDVVSIDAVPLPAARSCRFESSGGTIGRDETSTLVLPDQHRRVSRLHAAVSFSADVPNITNASTSLPISVGEVTLDCGQTMPLSSGDVVEIGPYILRVQPIIASDSSAHKAVEPVEDLAGGLLTVVTEVFPSSGVQGSISEPLYQALSPAVQAPTPGPTPGLVAGPVASPIATSTPVALTPASGEPDPFASLLAGIGSRTSNAASPVEAVIDLGAYRQPAQQPPLVRTLDDPLAGLSNGRGQIAGQPVAAVSGVSTDPLAALGFGLDPGAAPFSPSAQRAGRPPAAIIPQDFNPFQLPSGTSRNSADPLSSLLGHSTAPEPSVVSRGEPSIDSLFTPSGSSNLDGLLSGSAVAPSWQAGPESLFATADNSDPLSLFGNPSQARDSQMRPMRDDLAEIGGAYQPPRAFEPEVPKMPPAQHFPAGGLVAHASVPGSAAATDVLTQAFLKGANLPLSVLPQGLTPEIMAMVGSLLRSATTGAVDMLTARTATKLEVQASVTVISAQANNPLKFLPNGEVALQQLLSKKMPGFMPADEAMKDAFDDLRAHEIGVIAGTRAALAEVLGKFDPIILGERLVGGSLFDSFLPSVRKTKLWDIYLERYSQIRREAEDDFQSIFGRAFVQAYERETTRMKAQKTKGEEAQ